MAKNFCCCLMENILILNDLKLVFVVKLFLYLFLFFVVIVVEIPMFDLRSLMSIIIMEVFACIAVALIFTTIYYIIGSTTTTMC